MAFEETRSSAARLAGFLDSAIADLKPEVADMTEPPKNDLAAPSAPIKKNLTGASFLADLIRQQQAAIKTQLAKAGEEMSIAMTELQDTANEATNQVKAVKAETADLRAALGMNSNQGE